MKLFEIQSDRLKIIENLGFKSSNIPALKKYIELLWSTNEELNLVSRKMTEQDLIDNHIIDCLLPLKFFPTEIKNAADFGSGGGLPAIIYAIQFPHIHFHLYEKSPKKQIFLNKCKESLALNITVHSDIPTKLNNIDVVMARGFKPIDVILEMSRDYYEKDGSYFLLKARAEKIAEEVHLAHKKFKKLEIKMTSLKSPLLEVERNLVQI